MAGAVSYMKNHYESDHSRRTPPTRPVEVGIECLEAALGRLEDLPADYREALGNCNLVPLWPALRSLLPPRRPQARTREVMWPYSELRPLLMRAGELAPIEKAERRVLVLANPGHGPESRQASPATYLGMQLLLPGEWAPSHRHTPNAVRLIVEGEGAYTTVDGHKLAMSRGDLILTPTGSWHEHGHDGREPVIWLDVLDLPLVHYLEASYHCEGYRQTVRSEPGPDGAIAQGLMPAPAFERTGTAHPLLRYTWRDTRAALLALARDASTQLAVQVAYVNPHTGEDAQRILGFYALMLRPGQSVVLPPRSPAAVFHVIEGWVDLHSSGTGFALEQADTVCVPGFRSITLGNRSAVEPAFLFVADEAPLHRKLGLYEVRHSG